MREDCASQESQREAGNHGAKPNEVLDGGSPAESAGERKLSYTMERLPDAGLCATHSYAALNESVSLELRVELITDRDSQDSAVPAM